MVRPIYFIIFFCFKSYCQFTDSVSIDSSLPITNTITCLVTVDIDNDGLKDLIVANYQNNISWYKNLGNLAFSSSQVITTSISNTFFIDFGDTNLDSHSDLLVTVNDGNNSKIMLMNNSTWNQTIIDSNIDVGCYRSYFVDFDNDNDLDIIACSDLYITYYSNDGLGNYGPRTVLLSGAEYYNMCVGNFNNDDYIDIAINSSNGNQIFYNNTSVGLGLSITLNFNLGGYVFNVNMDNLTTDEVIFNAANSGFKYNFFKNSLDGYINYQTISLDDTNDQNPTISYGKINNDDFYDCAYFKFGNGLFWKQNDLTGQLLNSTLVDDTKNYFKIILTDIDNDGDSDLLYYGSYFTTNVKELGLFENNSELSNQEFTEDFAKNIFPNPFTNFLVINSFDPSFKAEIFDMTGKLILHSSESIIYTNTISQGTYICKITDNQSQVRTKLLVKE